MPQVTCLSDDVLQSLLLGKLPEAEAGPAEEHLLECPACLARTEDMRLSDTLIDALRGAGSLAISPRLVAAAERLTQRLADRSALATHITSLDATDGGGSVREAIDELRARFDPPQAPDEIGRLGGFRILRLLGSGGMGAVFRAEDLQLCRPVALKLVSPRLTERREGTERFLREARAAAAVKHDHVVTVYQVGEANGLPFLAQELLEGETLQDRLDREGRLSPAEALRIGREIALGLDAAHGRHLLHRDIKPSNIWLEGPRGRVKILDFGLARVEGGDSQLTRSGMILGTPAYMSPEQAQGQSVDSRTDLFSLGAVLYRMTTGRPAFQGNDAYSLLRSLAVDTPPEPRSLNPQVPPAFSDEITRLLTKDKAARPNSAAQLAERLAALTATLPAPAGMAVGDPQAGIPRADRRPRIGVIALGATAAVLLAAIIIRITHKDGTTTEIKVSDGSKVAIAEDPAGTIGKPDPRTPDAPANGGKPADPKPVGGKPDPAAEAAAAFQPPGGGEWPTRTAATWKPGPKEDAIPGLVPRPAVLPGVVRWQIESITPREIHFHAVRLSPDGKYVACAPLRGRAVRLYNAESGELVGLFPHPQPAMSISWHPESKQLATGGVDGHVRLWGVDGSRGASFAAHKDFADVQWSPDGQLLAVRTSRGGEAGRGVVRLWAPDGTAGPELRVEGDHVPFMSWSSDGKRLAASNGAGVFLWKSDGTAGPVIRRDGFRIGGVGWHPDNVRLAFGYGGNGKRSGIGIANTAGETLKTIEWELEGLPGWLAWSPDGEHLAAGLDAYGFVLLNADGTPAPGLEKTAGRSPDGTEGLWWSPDGEYLLRRRSGGGRICRSDGTELDPLPLDPIALAGWRTDGKRVLAVHPKVGLVWSTPSGETNVPLDASIWNLPGATAAWHPRQPALVAGRSPRWWALDARAGFELHSFEGGEEHCLCSPDGATLLGLHHYGHVDFRDVRGRLVGRQALGFGGPAPGTWNPAGTETAIAGPDGSIHIIGLGSQRTIEHAGVLGTTSPVVWSPDGEHIAAWFGKQSVVRLWKPDGTPGPSFEMPLGVGGIAWHPRSRRLAIAFGDGDSSVRTLNLDGTPGLTFRFGPAATNYQQWKSGWNSDGSMFAGGGGDGYTVAWNDADATVAWSSQLHTSAVVHLEWHRDGTHLATQSTDGTVRIWNGRTGDNLFVVCCANEHEVFSFDAAGQLLHGNAERLDAWFRCVIEEPEGKFTTLKPSEFAQRFPEFISPGSWPEPGKPTDPERVAAQWLFDAGCSELGIYAAGVEQVVRKMDDLPPIRFSIGTIRGPLSDGDLLRLNPETFPDLFRIYLVANGATHAGVRTLKRLPNLRELSLAVVDSTPQELTNGLAELPQLQRLGLGGHYFTNQMLKPPTGLPELWELQLINGSTSVDDGAIDTLKQIPKLRWLDVRGTKFTAAGRERLKKELPRCTVLAE